MEIVNIAQKFNLFNQYWSPRIVGGLNDSHVKLAKLHGEFVWPQHGRSFVIQWFYHKDC